MLRRIGYGLGLLFVLACVAAYPLTWGRMRGAFYVRPGFFVLAEVADGLLWVNVSTLRINDEGFEWQSSFTEGPDSKRLYLMRCDREVLPEGNLGKIRRIVAFPLWMPALSVSLFMTWRWRRRRTRRGAGFPVDEVSN